MSKINKLNKKIVKFNFEPEDNFIYVKLEDLFKENGKDTIYRVRGLYINNNGYYGKSPLAVLDNCFLNLPQHLVETVEVIHDDEELIQDINDGKMGFKIYEYLNKKQNKRCYSVEWVEIDPEPVNTK